MGLNMAKSDILIWYDAPTKQFLKKQKTLKYMSSFFSQSASIAYIYGVCQPKTMEKKFF